MEQSKRRILTTVPPFIWSIADRIAEKRRKHQAKRTADTIDNLERLHRLKEKGVLTEEEFAELKEKLKSHIG